MTVALARKKGFVVKEDQAKKEVGFAVATEVPFLEPMRNGSTMGGGGDTLGYTLMGMAAAGYPADTLTDSHVHYLSVYQFPHGHWNTTSYRTPTEYGPFTSTAVALLSIRLYPITGRHEEFEERYALAKRWLLGAKATSMEEHTMQLIGLAAALRRCLWVAFLMLNPTGGLFTRRFPREMTKMKEAAKNRKNVSPFPMPHLGMSDGNTPKASTWSQHDDMIACRVLAVYLQNVSLEGQCYIIWLNAR
jgi:hypothetical protein